MIRFMVCDTDTAFLEKLAYVLHSHFDPCTVEYLYGPFALETALQSDSGGADILLTEIELREHSAIAIIQKYMKESSPLQVIYMTPKVEYCTDVYETRHIGFLLKPIKLELLLRDVRRACSSLELRKRNGIVIQHGGRVHILMPQTLLYIESCGRVLRITTDTEALETYDKISHFSLQLDKRFLQCHKSYIINLERVKRYCGDSFYMENGDSVPISQSRRKEVREYFLQYMGSAAVAE